MKGYHLLYYRTPFGIVPLTTPRLYHCACQPSAQRTFSVLSHWLPDHVSPELQYLEAKWASLIAYGVTAKLLKDVLPVGDSLNAATVRNHLHKVAQRQERDLEGKPDHLGGCPRDWAKLPKPSKPMTVGIDGGYVRNWHEKSTNFEIIAGKSVPKHDPSKRFGFVQKFDENPRRRLMHVLKSQGMQANQQITFLSDGADNLRALQFMMYPESEHVLDWVHVTMRLTVLGQFAKGMIHTDPEEGERVVKGLESTKWYLWHGNVNEALEHIEECCLDCGYSELQYSHRKKFAKQLNEFYTYIQNNVAMIPNYGEKYRYGETISTAFVESTINEVVAKRMVKKQQMQWSHEGAHYLLQTRTAVLNDELQAHFRRWYPEFSASSQQQEDFEEQRLAA